MQGSDRSSYLGVCLCSVMDSSLEDDDIIPGGSDGDSEGDGIIAGSMPSRRRATAPIATTGFFSSYLLRLLFILLSFLLVFSWLLPIMIILIQRSLELRGVTGKYLQLESDPLILLILYVANTVF